MITNCLCGTFYWVVNVREVLVELVSCHETLCARPRFAGYRPGLCRYRSRACHFPFHQGLTINVQVPWLTFAFHRIVFFPALYRVASLAWKNASLMESTSTALLTVISPPVFLGA